MKYFLFDHSGSLNRGCEAIIRGTTNIISRADKNASFKLASYRPETDLHFGVETGNMKARELSSFENLISAFSIKLLGSERYALKKMYSPVIEQGGDCDICLSIGGDTYCYGDNASVREITAQLHKHGKKTVLWGASVGREDLSAEKIRGFKNFDAVFTREPLTYSILSEFVEPERLFIFADPAFCMEREDLPLPDGFEPGNTMGFNLSPLVTNKNPEIVDACVNFLKFVITDTTLQIALVPHVTEEGNNDCDILDEICNKINAPRRIIRIPGSLNAMQYKGYIARLRFFIGARTHATIAAYSNGVPTIVLGYSVKSRGISKDLFGEEKFVVDASELHSSKMLEDEFIQLIRQEDEIKSQLKSVVPEKLKSAMSAGIQLMKL